MNKNDNFNFKTTTDIYFEHIGTQLFKIMFSHMKSESLLKKCFHPYAKDQSREILYSDDIYLQCVSKLNERKLSYYIKNLKMIVKEDEFKLIDIKYEYYDKNESISHTNVQMIYVQ